MEDSERFARLERAVLGIADVLDTTEPLPEIEVIRDEIDNTPNEQGHTPKMLRDWEQMQDSVMAGEAALGNDIDRDTADAYLDDMFGKIERGELNPDGSPLAS